MKFVRILPNLRGSFDSNDGPPQLANDKTRNSNLTWLKAVEVVSVERTSETTGRIVFRFPVQREYLNPGMTLHGGMSAGMFDTATTWVLDLIRKPGFWMSFGTSRSLNLTFIRPAMEGETLLMDCEVSLRPARSYRSVFLMMSRLCMPASGYVSFTECSSGRRMAPLSAPASIRSIMLMRIWRRHDHRAMPGRVLHLWGCHGLS